MSEPAVRLKRGKSGSLLRRHPYVFSGALEPDIRADDGDVVKVVSDNGEYLGRGHYQASGSIRVRMLTFDDEPVDRNFWRKRIGLACDLRSRLGLLDNPSTNAFRLVHGEGDGLSGLVADMYAGSLVIQPHSQGMSRSMPEIQSAFRDVLGAKLKSIYVAGADKPSPFEIKENGHRFIVDLAKGQKTGFYLDQRENRRLVQDLAAGKKVLNAFAYTGSFAVYAIKGGAESVCSLDASAAARDTAGQIMEMNGISGSVHKYVVEDAFDFLKKIEDSYNLVILDPPAFAKHLSARHAAIQAYRRLNAMAMKFIEKRGMLFTFSCSQVVTPDLFRGAVLAASIDSGRKIQILYQLRQPPDHPVSIYHPEGEYLKGFVLLVD